MFQRRVHYADEYIESLNPKEICDYWEREEEADFINETMGDIASLVVSKIAASDYSQYELYDDIYEYLVELGYREDIKNIFQHSFEICES